jgi:hypothetical protein
VEAPADEHFPRFALDDNEHVSLIATHVAAGQWQEIGLLPGQPPTWFLNFARSLKGDPADAMTSILSILQLVLMAQRKSTFLEIQFEPAFSSTAQANAITLARASRGGDADFIATWNRIFAGKVETQVPEQMFASYDGGPGDVPENAVTIQAPDLELAVRAEYWYLFYSYGRKWTLGREQRTMPAPDGRVFDQLELIFPDQNRKWAYFDVTALVTPSSHRRTIG